MHNIVFYIIKKVKNTYNTLVNLIYLLIKKLNKNKTNIQKQVEQLSKVTALIRIKVCSFKYWNIIIIILWIILYLTSWLTMIRIKYFITILIIIGIYKVVWEIMQKKIQNIKISEKFLYVMLKISVINNIILYIIGRLDLILYKKEKKHVINLLIPIKIFYYYIYHILYNFRVLTIYDIIWKRAYGTILSVLIFTNIIQILIIECGGRLNLILCIYLVMVSLCYIEKEKKIYYLYNIDVLSIWKKRAEANLICYYVKEQWQSKTWMEKLKFLKIYGSNINLEWLDVLNIKSSELFEMESYVKHKKDLNNAYVFENFLDLENLINDLLKYESELEYLNLLYKNEKYNEKLQIIMKHNVNELLMYNNIMIKAVLYYIWDIKSPDYVKIILDVDNGLELQKKDLKTAIQETNLSIENHRILYDIKLFSFLYEQEIGYMTDSLKYEMYMKYWEFDNMQISFQNKKTHEIITNDLIKDTVDIRINTIDVSEINQAWELVLNQKIIQYNKEYKKGLYLGYFKKLKRCD